MSKCDELKSKLEQNKLRYVGYRGDNHAPICFVGEAPGADEDVAGIPFIGSSGRELDRMIEDAGMRPGVDCWFTNVYKTRPPNNDIFRIDELGVDKNSHIEAFLEEMNEHKPKIIVACGATALGALCYSIVGKNNDAAQVRKYRGSLLSSELLRWEHFVVPMYHPAFILREWTNRQFAVFCIARAWEEFQYYQKHGRLMALPERSLLVNPSYHDATEYLSNCLQFNNRVSVDIETLRRAIPFTISLARSPDDAISFGLWQYSDEQCGRLLLLLDKILRCNPQIGQNYLAFDTCWLQHIGFRPNTDLIHDTMIKHHILWPEFEHSLQFMCAQYTREPFYKDDGKEWRFGNDISQLMRYNAKDAAVTYEVFLEQDKELAERGLWNFYYDYQMPLARKFHWIDKRGIMVDPVKITELRRFIQEELGKSCSIASQAINKPCAINKPSADKLEKQLGKPVLNISSPKQLIRTFKSLGIKIHKDRKTQKESTNEVFLQRAFAETGNAFVKEVLRIRELTKILGTYVDAKLKDNILYSSYAVTGTVTGRRSSRKNYLGLGANHQNQPKHSDLGKKFSSCVVARPGKILITCDQIQAEDWIVQGMIADLSGDFRGLDELRSGVDRHSKLASAIFGKPESACGKGSPERFMGKKTRHAAQYDMRAKTMSDSMAKEGFSAPENVCEFLLQKFHEVEPKIRGVYQKYIQNELITNRKLRTPFGRERVFFGLRPFTSNSDIFREAYAYIPQSTIGDNTGFAILWMEENHPGLVIMDIHDAIRIEVADDDEAIVEAVDWLTQAFNREIKFSKFSINIPVEIELGYDLENVIKCSNLGLKNTLATFRERVNLQTNIIGGPLRQ